MLVISILIGLLLTAVAIVLYGIALKRRNMDRWILNYYFPATPSPRSDWREEPVDVFLAVCDHYEPERGHVSKATALELVNRWVEEYPAQFARFADSDGRPPQHTFFFPQDEYQPEYLDALKNLCDAGFGDVDVHLHHHNDTAAQLQDKLEAYRDTLHHRHGLLRTDPRTGEIVYGFIHGNWALCNSDPLGEYCGVDEELTVLKQTGCYADFTMPSAPSATQTQTINQIYYARDTPGKKCGHATGVRAAVGREPDADSLLMIQGPLCPDWKHPKWGVLPRIENADLHAGRPATWSRFERWMNAHVHVAGRPEWRFIKLHTHGCKVGNIDTLLGAETVAFHEQLQHYARTHPEFRVHYVTAWEMALLVRQAEAGFTQPLLTSPDSSASTLNTPVSRLVQT